MPTVGIRRRLGADAIKKYMRKFILFTRNNECLNKKKRVEKIHFLDKKKPNEEITICKLRKSILRTHFEIKDNELSIFNIL